MHYRHSYHAGNFADVFKHLVLCGLLRALNRKDKPWCYLETHSGAGAYDLAGESAARTGEWRDGIGRLLQLEQAPEPMATYLGIVRSFSPPASRLPPRIHYPGSPLIARSQARDADRLVLCEKILEIVASLKNNTAGDRRITVHQRDGYEAHALLPPAEKRGLVLVDPPFERPDEFEAVAELLEKSVARFAGGVYAVWYPLKNRHAAARFERRAARLAKEPPLRLVLENGAKGEGQMRACAMLVLNAPYRFETEIQPALALLAKTLAQGRKAQSLIETVKP